MPVTVAFTCAALVAALVTGRLGDRIDTDRLRRWFAYLVVAVAVAVAAGVLVQVGA